jgi:rhamnopyranosyl-N-acetylglucosaminyl-diphospho-decaprenol beta-1,3/1,4-galactofuranosyltransferase
VDAVPAPAPDQRPDDRRVVAVVVTFNRRDLLARLLGVLRRTPGLAEVVVVDNASTDGTGDWLATEATEATATDGVPVHVVTLPENRGGAGGFHSGLRVALERGADLAWLMDDDGVPEDGCLARLLEHDGELDFWGPVVVDEDDPDRLVFPIRLPGGTRTVRRMDEVAAAAVDGVIRDVVIPFNGVLVTRELVDRIGLPREEFFIWGDDHEYRLRAEQAGGRIATVVEVAVRHPNVGELGTPMMFGRTTYNHSPSDLKHYCMARNNTVNLRDYRGWPHVLAFLGKTLWFYAVTRPSAARLRLSAGAVLAGLRGDFTGHRRFLA